MSLFVSKLRQKSSVLTLATCLLVSGGLAAQEVEKVIPNHLNQSWPWDPTYFEVDPAVADRLTVAHIQGRERP
ncbi:MAG: hypothetical protein EA401_13695, partial [Planctomycetota bacterium]